MCGIAGIINYDYPIDISTADKMMNIMSSRGPDAEGAYHTLHASLMHRRLAVVDIEKSTQPMTKIYNGKTYTIVYNGELYNTEEIKTDLMSRGFEFSTRGDTEVILNAYIFYGKKCCELFNGIFAFAVWSKEDESLFFARDPMGVKPFFYHTGSREFIFASTVPALLEHPHIPHTINSASVCEILLLGPGRSPGSGIFTSISELPPGVCGVFDKTGINLTKYFHLQDKPHTKTFGETASDIKYLVTDAIKRQLISDVPLGTFLSGGLDSSLISAVAAEEFKKNGKTLDTFSVTYKDQNKYFTPSHFQPNSDEKYIEIMAKHIGSNHHEIVLDTSDVISSLYPIVDEKGLPAMADVDSSLLSFCKKIREKVTVALSGECADECAHTS